MENYNTWSKTSLVHEINELEDLKKKSQSLSMQYYNPKIDDELKAMYVALKQKVLTEIAEREINILLERERKGLSING
jgi:hypothetical protein